MDVFFSKYNGKQRKVLVTVDHYSDFFEANFLKDLKPASVIKPMKENFSRFGIPEIVCTDNATNFVNEKMQAFFEKYQLKHITNSLHHSQGNRTAESAVKIAKNIMKKCVESKEDFWYSLLHWRNTPNKMGSSPVQRLMSRNTRNGISACENKYLPNDIENVSDKIKEQRRNSKLYYDKKTKKLPKLQIGESVHVQLKPKTDKLWTSARVEQELSDRSYLVEVNEAKYRRDRTHIRAKQHEEGIYEDPEKGSTEKKDYRHLKISTHPTTPVKQPVSDNEKCKMPVSVCNKSKLTVTDGDPKGIINEEKTEERPKRTVRFPKKFEDYVY